MSWGAVNTGRRLELSGSTLDSGRHTEGIAIRGRKKIVERYIIVQ
jgi:hypothetical protein